MRKISRNHPIALAIKAEYEKRINNHTISHSCTHTTHENISGMGIKATCNYQNILAGNDKILHKFNVPHDNCHIQGTVAHIAVNDKYAGYIMIADELKDDSVSAIRALRDLGVKKMAMLTGDNEFASKEISASLGLDCVHYNLLPEEKARIFSDFASVAKGKSVFVGDGINDAPSIAVADIGISMGGVGSDVSKESADILIVDDSITKIATAIKIARRDKAHNLAKYRLCIRRESGVYRARAFWNRKYLGSGVWRCGGGVNSTIKCNANLKSVSTGNLYLLKKPRSACFGRAISWIC